MSAAIDLFAQHLAERPAQPLVAIAGVVTGEGADSSGTPMVLVRLPGTGDSMPCYAGSPLPGGAVVLPPPGTTVLVITSVTPPWAICARATEFAPTGGS